MKSMIWMLFALILVALLWVNFLLPKNLAPVSDQGLIHSPSQKEAGINSKGPGKALSQQQIEKAANGNLKDLRSRDLRNLANDVEATLDDLAEKQRQRQKALESIQ